MAEKNTLIPKNKFLVGIRREDKSYWERRVTIAPVHAQEIMKKHKDLQFIVQPSDRRIFSDSEYQNIGCIIEEDLSCCSVILGVKEIPPKKLMANKTYMFFSHTIKAQSENMPTLDHMLQNNIRMLDYEKITGEDGARKVAFGRFAGIAGAIDYLAGFGQFILQKGYSTPFLSVSPSYKYFNLDQAYEHIFKVGQELQQTLIPIELCPMVFAITGKGRCSLGAYEVLKNLPHQMVEPEDLQKLCENKNDVRHRTTIYITYIQSQHMVAHQDGRPFNKKDYYKNPEDFKPIFSEKYLPYITSIFHNMYWDQRFPRLISCEEMRTLYKNGQDKLIGIGDVTCDFEGSIEFLRKFTTPDEPFWIYDPITEEVQDGVNYKPGSLLYQSLDFLPCELAYDASMHFSGILKDWVYNIASSDINAPYEKQTLLPHVKRAMITLQGKLTPDFEYIEKLRKDKEKQSGLDSKQTKKTGKVTSYMKIKLQGHLFINKVINKILDICEENQVNFNVTVLTPGTDREELSILELLLYNSDGQILGKNIDQIKKICEENDIELTDAPIIPNSKKELNNPRL